MYRVDAIGDLSGGLAGQPWPGMPPGWVPEGTPGLPGVPAPVPGPPRAALSASTVDGPALVAVVVSSLAIGSVGMWLWNRYGGKRAKKR